jgi:hypothetical protein
VGLFFTNVVKKLNEDFPPAQRDQLGETFPGATQQTAGQYTSFIRAMDAASSVSGLGQTLGLFGITPDALSGAARLLGVGVAAPLAYTADVDSALRALLGFSSSLPAFQPSPTTPAPAGSRAIAACVKLPLGKKSTTHSGISFKP